MHRTDSKSNQTWRRSSKFIRSSRYCSKSLQENNLGDKNGVGFGLANTAAAVIEDELTHCMPLPPTPSFPRTSHAAIVHLHSTRNRVRRWGNRSFHGLLKSFACNNEGEAEKKHIKIFIHSFRSVTDLQATAKTSFFFWRERLWDVHR